MMLRAVRRARYAGRDFLASEAAGGIFLIIAAALALIVANLPGWSQAYFDFLQFEAGPVLSPAHGPMTVHLWINDGLMALFFLLVGLEIKREAVDGRLASWERRRLPVFAAAAGMAVPAAFYLAITSGTPLAKGWAIPAATDIAFAMGVLALLGSRVPASLKLFLTTVAIVDDLGAVAIIAVVYSAHLDLAALGGAALVLAVMYALNRWGVTRLLPYLVLALPLWYLVFLSGVHATIAGVAAAMTIPIRAAPIGGAHPALHRLQHALHPWSAFLVVPLFGFANAGVPLAGVSAAALLEPLPLGIALGLFLGKQIGIFGSIWLAARTRFAAPPPGASWTQIYGMALLAGIGFTMSLFIGGLAFPARPELGDAVKIGVLAGSLLSALTGFAVLRFVGRPPLAAG